MAAQTNRSSDALSGDLGATLIALTGIGLIVYGIVFLIFNFTGLIELGLTAEHIGVTAEEIQAFSPDLYHYISHVQTATGAFIMALGIAVFALAWYGVRKGYWWAFWTAVIAPALAIGIALPVHYVWGFDALSHLGVVYLLILLWLVGVILAYRKLRS